MSTEKPKQQKKLFSGSFNSNKQPGGFNIYWIYGIIFLVFIVMTFMSPSVEPQEITWNRFENEMLKNNDVEKIVIVNKERAEVFLKADRLKEPRYKDVAPKKKNDNSILPSKAVPNYFFNVGSAEIFNERLEKYLQVNPKSEQLNISYETRKDVFGDILGWLMPLIIIVIIWVIIFRRMNGKNGPGGNIFNVGKSKAKLFDKESNIKTNFSNVAGLEEAKIEIMEIVEFLKSPKKYTDLGGKIPKGVLLVGPPGTGKTLLAKAVAGEANVPFFSLSGSDFVEMFVGVGASRVRDLFQQAKIKSPCIIFIDEIDAIGRARGKNASFPANDERENTLNQLLSEMDGFEENSGVIIMAATNRVDILDRALLRAGRFDRLIMVDLPDLPERKAIFNVHLKPLKTDTKLDLEFLAKQTAGFSGADIANVCNEAALIAARKNKGFVDKQDFLDAVDRIVAGLERKNKIISMEERKKIAYHEAGHATVSWHLEHAHPLVKVTIVPRGRALGAAWYLPEERQLTTKEQMHDDICSTLGGRASEEIIFNEISTGALNDLERTTKQAYAMVTYFGMSKNIGNLSFYDSSGQSEFFMSKPYSEKTSERIDEEVQLIIQEQYEKAKCLLRDHRRGLEKLANKLLEKEVIFREDLEEIFGKRPYEEIQNKDAAHRRKAKTKAALLRRESKIKHVLAEASTRKPKHVL